VKTEKKNKMLLLGSSHAREIGPMLQDNLGTKSDICSTHIFKPNVPLAKAEDIPKLGRNLTKQEHIIIVQAPKHPGEKLSLFN
jgi:hypothetical protein